MNNPIEVEYGKTLNFITWENKKKKEEENKEKGLPNKNEIIILIFKFGSFYCLSSKLKDCFFFFYSHNSKNATFGSSS